MSRDDLTAAVAQGIITPEQAEQLAVFMSGRVPAPESGDAEEVRFARGFHDVFLTIGLVILLTGVVTSAGIVVGTLAGFLGAGVAWLLAEYYARSRMLVLPSIVLGAAFVAMMAVGAGTLVEAFTEGDGGAGAAEKPWYALAAALAALTASGGFLARFRLPFAMALVAVSATATLIALVAVAAPDSLERFLRPLLLVAGATCFCAAMIYDLSDPGRTGMRADNAFWLHLAAAPLIVHSVIGSIAQDASDITLTQAVLTMAVLAAVGLAALIIDRRAMLVAGLTYLGIAIGALVREAQVDTGSVFAITLLFLGAAVVALGTGWQPARRAVIEAIIPARLAARLPTLRTDPQ